MVIVVNTLNVELLIRSLQVIRHMITYMHATDLLYITPGLKSHALNLVSWATERLEEEGRGIGIGGFNKTVAKNLMHVVWAIGAYGIVESNEYGKIDPMCSRSHFDAEYPYLCWQLQTTTLPLL